MRQLTTIGNLRSMRELDRASRMHPMLFMGMIGQTLANFATPTLSQVDATPPGTALSSATRAMLSHFAAAGVPSEHTADPFVTAFQTAWNADPAPWISQLSVDGGFGNNTHDAAESIVDYTGGGSVPAVNAGQTVTPPPAPALPPTPHPIVVHQGGDVWPWVVGAVIVGAVGYGVAKWARKRKGGRRRRSTSKTFIFA